MAAQRCSGGAFKAQKKHRVTKPRRLVKTAQKRFPSRHRVPRQEHKQRLAQRACKAARGARLCLHNDLENLFGE
jgi:hypothetical protein